MKGTKGFTRYNSTPGIAALEVLLLIVVAAILVGGVWLWFRSVELGRKPPVELSQGTPGVASTTFPTKGIPTIVPITSSTITSTPTPWAPVIIQDWPTYESDLGFKFQHPSHYELDRQEGCYTGFVHRYPAPDISSRRIGVSVLHYTGQSRRQLFFEEFAVDPALELVIVNDRMVGGVDALEIAVNNQGGVGKGVAAVIPYKDKIIIFWSEEAWTDGKELEGNVDLWHKIIDTFSFTQDRLAKC